MVGREEGTAARGARNTIGGRLPTSPFSSLCCLCGASILPNPSTMCVACIRSQVDITEALSKQVREERGGGRMIFSIE